MVRFLLSYSLLSNFLFLKTDWVRMQEESNLIGGGTGDDDGEQNAMIEDPSGLGIASADNHNNDNSSGGGSGGCFIGTLVNDFK